MCGSILETRKERSKEISTKERNKRMAFLQKESSSAMLLDGEAI